MPSGSAAFRSAPASTRIRAHSTQPSRLAYSSGVIAPSGSHFSRGSAVVCRSHFSMFERALTSAPRPISSRTTAGCRCAAAHIRAVWPCQLSRGVNRRAAIEQQLHRLDPAGPRRGHQRRLALGSGGVDIDPGLQQPLDHRGVAVDAGQGNRRHAVAVHRLHVGAGPDQHLGELEIVFAHRPVKRRGAVGLGRVDVDALAKQRGHRRRVPGLHRVDDAAIGAPPCRATWPA